jgi:hypothetical protein
MVATQERSILAPPMASMRTWTLTPAAARSARASVNSLPMCPDQKTKV